MEIKEIAFQEHSAWDALVASSPEQTVFLTDDFLKTWVSADPEMDLFRLGCYEDGSLVGGIVVLHKKTLKIIRIQNILSIFYASTPIISGKYPGHTARHYEIMTTLASSIRKYFPYLRLECNPCLDDVSAFLNEGWTCKPRYSHMWDIRDPEEMLNSMHRKKRYVKRAMKEYCFTCGIDEDIEDFLTLYLRDLDRFSWQPSDYWIEAFRKRVTWMKSQNIFRLYTCRTQDGQLANSLACILSPCNKTAYGWLVAYDRDLQDNAVSPSIYYYAALDLCGQFDYLDIGEAANKSIYAYKDSMGTSIHPFWVMETTSAKSWLTIYKTLQRAKWALSRRMVNR
ncbi:MAG TPA: hypothetical protein VF338_07595 [Leptolinea sp.]